MVTETKTKETQAIVRDGRSWGVNSVISQVEKLRPREEYLAQGHICRTRDHQGYITDVLTPSPNSLHEYPLIPAFEELRSSLDNPTHTWRALHSLHHSVDFYSK